MFDLQRGDEQEEDSGHRSILGLGRAALASARREGPPPRAPEPLTITPGGHEGRRSLLGLETIEFGPEWKVSAAATARRSVAGRSEPVSSEETKGRSLLGLEAIDLEPEWRAAVAANATPPLRPIASRGGTRSRDGKEDSHYWSSLGFDEALFVPERPAAPGSATPPAAVSRPTGAAHGRGRDIPRDLPFSLREPSEPLEIDPPQFERELRPPHERPIPVERAILLSLALHILLFLGLTWAPAGGVSDARHGLLAGLMPEPQNAEEKIPIVFRSSSGPERENPKRSDPSDKTRRAGGGDPSRPKSDTPFSPERPGIEGLAQGRNAQASRAKPSVPPANRSLAPATRQAEGGRGTVAEKAPATAEAFKISPPGSGSSSAEGRRAQDPTQLAGLDQAIRQAAREVQAAGENGSGFPNPDGGFVDTGGLSFESTWFEWGDYWETFVRRVKLHWKVPIDLMMLGAKGKVTITLAILADGRLADLKIVRPSVTIPFNFAAEQALETSSPFRPLPKELLAQVPGKDRERVTVTFFYNMRVGHENGAEEPPKPNPR